MDIKKYIFNNKNKYFIFNLDSYGNEEELLNDIGMSIKHGIWLIHIKFNKMSDYSAVNLGNKIRDLCSVLDALLIVERRLDISKIISSDGVFLNSDDIPLNYAKKMFDSNFLIGCGYDSYDNKIPECDFILSKNNLIKEDNLTVFYEHNANNKHNRCFYNINSHSDFIKLVRDL